MTEKQPEALRLAAWLDGSLVDRWPSYVPQEAATELRHQHKRIEELEAQLEACTNSLKESTGWSEELIHSQLEAVGAGGVSQLVPAQCLQQSAEPAPAAQRDELLQAAIDFIGTLTGTSPPPIEIAPPEVFTPFYAFVARVQAITATQPARVPLSRRQIEHIRDQVNNPPDADYSGWDDVDALQHLIKFVEAAHGITAKAAKGEAA